MLSFMCGVGGALLFMCGVAFWWLSLRPREILLVDADLRDVAIECIRQTPGDFVANGIATVAVAMAIEAQRRPTEPDDAIVRHARARIATVLSPEWSNTATVNTLRGLRRLGAPPNWSPLERVRLRQQDSEAFSRWLDREGAEIDENARDNALIDLAEGASVAQVRASLERLARKPGGQATGKSLKEEGRTDVYVANANEEGRTDVYVASGERRLVESAKSERLEKARLDERRLLESIKGERLETKRLEQPAERLESKHLEQPALSPPQVAKVSPPQALLAQPQAQPLAQEEPNRLPPQMMQATPQQGMQSVPPTLERVALDASTSGAQPLETPSYRSWRFASAVMVATCALVVAFLFWAQPPPPSLEITSIPSGAEVALDGTRVGLVTPVVVPTGIELGRTYEVSVMLDGYEAALVNVTPTEPLTRREVTLRPRLSRLRIETEPPGATVFARGAPRGLAPIVIDGLRMGEVIEVRVEAPGYQPLTEQFNVSAPDSIATLRMERLP